jgi:hypothetical protein
MGSWGHMHLSKMVTGMTLNDPRAEYFFCNSVKNHVISEKIS